MINRQNYETWFLLYVDNEITSNEKRMVENFVASNPDLQSEFLLFQSLKLDTTDSVSFPAKNELKHNPPKSITLQNVEEQFLLFIDNELSSAEAKEVELFVLQHPEVQENFTQLKQTVLTAEKIVFPNKEKLYKHSAKKPFVFNIYQPLAIAAVLFTTMMMIWLALPTKEPLKNNYTVQSLDSKPINSSAPRTSSSSFKKEQENTLQSTTESFQNTAEKNSYVDVTFSSTTSYQTSNNNNNTVVSEVALSNTYPVMANIVQSTAIQESNVDATHFSIQEVNAEPTLKLEDALSAEQSVVYKTLDTEDEDKMLLVGSLEINKDKLRGLVRRASTLFARNK